MKKAIFFDIDGTLIDENFNIPESAMQALLKLKESGHHIALCTGRAEYQIFKQLREIFPAIISSAGACVTYHDNLIFEHFVKKEDAGLLCKALEMAKAFLIGQTDEGTVISEKSYQYILSQVETGALSRERMETLMGKAIVTDHMEDCENVRKYFYHCSNKTVEEFSKELGHLFDFTPASFGQQDASNGEITCKDINKSFGIRKYIEYQNIAVEDTIAFGDGPNDLDMLSFVGTGVAMGNATKELKARADFITKDIKEDGIAYALKTFGLIN